MRNFAIQLFLKIEIQTWNCKLQSELIAITFLIHSFCEGNELLYMSEQLKIKRKQWLKCVSLSQDLRPGKIPCVLQRDEYNLGDIFLGVEYVMQQCKETSQDLHQTLTVRQTYTYSLTQIS